MSIRITESIRDAITRRLLDHRFDKETKALLYRENELALRLYRAKYSASERKAMEALPAGWMTTETSIRVSIKNTSYRLSLAQPVPVPYVDQGYSIKLEKLENDALEKTLNAFLKARTDHQNQVADLKKATAGALAGFSTINGLLAAWPEVKPFVDQLGFNAPKKSLPAVIPGDLSVSLGLAS